MRNFNKAKKGLTSHTKILVGGFYLLSGELTLRLAKLFDFTVIGT